MLYFVEPQLKPQHHRCTLNQVALILYRSACCLDYQISRPIHDLHVGRFERLLGYVWRCLLEHYPE